MDLKLVLLLMTLAQKSSVLAGTAFCTFEHTSRYTSDLITDGITGYMCKLDLDVKNDRVNDVGGGHEGGERDNQVDIIKVLPEYYSYLTSFPGTFCSRFSKLEIIDMCRTEIATIEANSLNKCKDLRILQFYLNKIEQIPEKMLAENKKLLKLFITFNLIRTLPENLLNGLKELKLLDLSYNLIDVLPEKVFHSLKNLEDLNLEGNKLENLEPVLFEHLEKLQKLNLNDNGILELPAAIFSNLAKLNYLSLRNNKLTIIHADSFPENIQIDTVVLTKNQINAIDQYFIETCGVGSLKMGGNICDKTSTIKKKDMKKKLEKCYENYKIAADAEDEANDPLTIEPITPEPTTTTTIKRTTTTTTTSEPITTEPTTEPTTTTSRPTSRTTPKKPKTTRSTIRTTRRQNKDELVPWIEPCGISKAAVQNIVGGTEVIKGTHPWIAALIDKIKGYFCGGTLISKRLVVTAAHCVLAKNSVQKTPGDFYVLLGAHELDNESEIGRTVNLVSDIRIDRNWNPNSRKFDADIAVLKMNEEVKFGTWIQPVCLPDVSAPLKNFQFGEVVGFGKFEKDGDHSNIPRKAHTPIRKPEDCYNEFPELLNIASHRTFCGGLADGTGACTGDSGGGLTVIQDDVHYLRGIVSASLHGTEYGCDVDSYSIYTDIRFFFNFIKNI